MRSRVIGATLLIVIVFVAFAGVRMARLKSYPPATIQDTISELPGYRIDEAHTAAPGDVPALVALRFPKESEKDGLGFPDRTDLYFLSSPAGPIECRASVRQNRLCHIRLLGSDASALRNAIGERYPDLAID